MVVEQVRIRGSNTKAELNWLVMEAIPTNWEQKDVLAPFPAHPPLFIRLWNPFFPGCFLRAIPYALRKNLHFCPYLYVPVKRSLRELDFKERKFVWSRRGFHRRWGVIDGAIASMCIPHKKGIPLGDGKNILIFLIKRASADSRLVSK